MKIAITTWHTGPNAGTFFQCYGLYSYLQSRGHEVKVIDYLHQQEDFLGRGFFYYASQAIPLLRRKLEKRKVCKQEIILQQPFIDQIQERNRRIDEFWKIISLTSPVISGDDFEKLNSEFDAFVVGSDQVWNATMLNRRYFLDYVNADKLKVAYGPSIGVGTVLPAQRKVYKQYVANFTRVAVREKLLCDILNEELPNLQAQHLLDPSMLCPREEYLKMAKLPQGVETVGYVLCYFAPNNIHQETVVRKYAEERKLKVVTMAMFGYSWTMKEDMIVCPDQTEFLGLILNAAAVFTSSFHCTIFSIFFHRDLFVFESKQVSKSATTNQRYIEQLNIYGISHRYIRWNENLNESILKPIDYNIVERIFQKNLKDSYDFLNQIF
ncbi:polysaccharide pyruvyl transferase family protein [Bacteroides clarus]|uniref:polysaccharide pyruvyl transferase family protein n=1 Tax=Bacteroides clarus TaxID=626929 RepID=UPI00248EBD6E|nr:polysaccharide pyruvyl transferase family protein [Bacteroides clarus]